MNIKSISLNEMKQFKQAQYSIRRLPLKTSMSTR